MSDTIEALVLAHEETIKAKRLAEIAKQNADIVIQNAEIAKRLADELLVKHTSNAAISEKNLRSILQNSLFQAKRRLTIFDLGIHDYSQSHSLLINLLFFFIRVRRH